MSETLHVALQNAPYDVVVGEGNLARLGEAVAGLGLTGKCAIITDDNVAPLYLQTVRDALHGAGFDTSETIVQAGEASKSMAEAESCCRQMIRAGHDRSSFLVALGGGVVGDLAGFVAAIFHRGIPAVQVPTTVVAQVDSSVGGKTGVNTPEGKNLIGAFHQPKLVWADAATLASLPTREFREGFAEIVKHAAIRDADMFPLIDAARKDPTQLANLVARNVAIKARIVEEDERETSGTRALLNFGHTIGHGIESAAGYGRYLHGEAIALGLRAAARLSVSKANLPQDALHTIETQLDALQLPRELPEDVSTPSIMAALATDKKFQRGTIRFVLLDSLGSATLSSEVNSADIENAIENLRA